MRVESDERGKRRGVPETNGVNPVPVVLRELWRCVFLRPGCEARTFLQEMKRRGNREEPDDCAKLNDIHAAGNGKQSAHNRTPLVRLKTTGTTWSKRFSSRRRVSSSDALSKRIQAEKCCIDVCDHKCPCGQDEDSKAELRTYAQGNSHRNTQGGKQPRTKDSRNGPPVPITLRFRGLLR